MASQFYQDRFDRPFPVTMLLLECLSTPLRAEGEEREDYTLRDVLAQAVEKADLLPRKVKDSDLVYLTQRIAALQQEQQDAAEEKGSGGEKRYFGSSYLQWITSLDHEGICFQLAGYNVEEARRLYCDVDYEMVLALARQQTTHHWHDKVVSFEACLFGFGGSYGEGGKDDQVYDLKKDRKAAEESLRALGF